MKEIGGGIVSAACSRTRLSEPQDAWLIVWRRSLLTNTDTMELLILGMLIGVGAARRKSLTKALAKGYMALEETTTHLRADMKDAIEEAKAEQEKEQTEPDKTDLAANAEIVSLHEEAATGYTGTAPILTIQETGRTSDSYSETYVEPTPKAEAESSSTQKPLVSLFKGVARGILAVTDATRSAAAHMREDMRDAVEEARYEREQDAVKRTDTAVSEPSLFTETPAVFEPQVLVMPVSVKAVKTRKTAAKSTEAAAEDAVKPKRRGRPAGVTAAATATSTAKSPVKRTRVVKPKTAASEPTSSDTQAVDTAVPLEI